MPKVLLIACPIFLAFFGVGNNLVARMTAADARCLHAARRGEIRRPETHAVHTRGGTRDVIDVHDAFGRFQDRMNKNWFLDAVFRFKLSKKLIEIMDVPCAIDLRQHDDIKFVADCADDFDDVIEGPRARKRIAADPEAGGAEVYVLAD